MAAEKERSAIPQEESPENHHVVPQSRGGSDREVNLAPVDPKRHDRFHGWAENRPPCSITRLMAIYSLGVKDRAVALGAVDELFQITTTHDWTDIYKDGAHVPSTSLSGMQTRSRNAGHLVTHFTEERLAIRQTMEAIVNGGKFPNKRSPFLKNAQRFFGAQSPLEAIVGLYNEEFQEQRTWVKTMQEQTQEQILAVLTGNYKPLSNKQLLWVLRNQEAHITKHIDAYERLLPRFRKRGSGNEKRRRHHRH